MRQKLWSQLSFRFPPDYPVFMGAADSSASCHYQENNVIHLRSLGGITGWILLLLAPQMSKKCLLPHHLPSVPANRILCGFNSIAAMLTWLT